MIELKHLSCYYKVKGGHLLVLDNIDLSIPTGQTLVVIGESGCGKTTLLKAIAGMLKYTEGDLLIDGRDVSEFNKRSNDMAYVNQEYVLYPHLTVFENIAYPLTNSKVKYEEINRMVREVAKRFGLTYLLTRKPFQLSGGQQQLVALARAFVKKPSIILLDEPFSNLDIETRRKMRKLVLNYYKEYNPTLVYVTHDIDDAILIADRIIKIDDGKIVNSYSPDEYKEIV